ncbi:hypothetical protein CLV45_1440 [Hymenobacter chitinivorans DSM 11115]|uniref:Uncharacterized protein n=2 Tax=Hymenobacter chitinivorans TaxID=89969 RepID=A0A2M9BPZ3_9BACT|nr:hypothetical protein CLV45_1440 [Hymenobacter chitinivorans DSM 11115]
MKRGWPRNQHLLLVAGLTSLLFVADVTTPLNINSLQLSYLVLVVALLSAVTYLCRALFAQHRAAYTGTVLVLAVLLSLVEFLFIYRGGWHTQSINYVNRESANTVIEFQMKDVGAFGYQKRTVEKLKLLPGISWMKETDPEKVDTLLWQPVNIDVNELGLIYP